TSPELQHEFCALWNQIVLKAQNDNDWGTVSSILRRIRSVYHALHQDIGSDPTRLSDSTTDVDQVLLWPSSYPVCNVAGHIHDVSASTSFVRTVLRDSTVLVPAHLASPNSPTLSIRAPLHAVESLTDVPPLGNFHPAHQTTIETFNVSVTSPDPAITGATRDIVTTGITTPHPTFETSASAPLLSSTSPPAPAVLQHNPDLLPPSDPPILPSSVLSHPVLDNLLPTESHRSIIVTTAPSTSPGPRSAPDLSTTAEDDGGPRPGLRKENG
ncbi:hypothetical protein BJY52DRAFT_1214146, partial [Lactarius psammicola]